MPGKFKIPSKTKEITFSHFNRAQVILSHHLPCFGFTVYVLKNHFYGYDFFMLSTLNPRLLNLNHHHLHHQHYHNHQYHHHHHHNRIPHHNRIHHHRDHHKAAGGVGASPDLISWLDGWLPRWKRGRWG